ncbi:HAD-IIIC family phosphatase [Terriglobus albidus]|nr:HAD-IIIC family phosphatase [Terriglobus albidus]
MEPKGPNRLEHGILGPMSDTEVPLLSTFALEDILMKRKGLKRRLSARPHLRPVRIAILGGATTNEVADLLELYLIESGFLPTLHQAEYGRFYVDAVHSPEALIAFAPDIVYLHTSVRDIQAFPPINATEADLTQYLEAELQRYRQIWTSLGEKLNCTIIQNNFEPPVEAVLGNLDASLPGGHTRFVNELNRAFATSATNKLLINDVASIAARVGLDRWFDAERWFSYKLHTTPEGSNALALSLAAIVRGIYGKTRKVLVLDLDNTVWGGVIGDDGVDKIAIGRETPLAEAYTAFQEYCLSLRNRGILLAVCSKNNEEIARQGFEHPDSVLKLEHISCFKANWDPKHQNIEAIARELNLGADSFVFVDDNPAERAIVEAQVAGIAVPNIGNEVSHYARIIEAGRYFEQTSFSKEDIERAALYQENSQRAAFESKFADYGEYLDSLEMTAEIARFKPLYLDRITQLTNKTNQFNLTTRRYAQHEIEAAAINPDAIGIYGKLTDRFGDNGLISIVLGQKQGTELDIELWLMSCRVLKRDMEQAMLDELVRHAQAIGITALRGTYIPTKKNGMVADHYDKLGFNPVSETEDGVKTYLFDLHEYAPRNTHIRLLDATEL